MTKVPQKRLLLLSSGKMRQYRQDVLRVLAAPHGARLQFRYDEGLVDKSLAEGLRRDDFVGRDVLIAHVDVNEEERLSSGLCRITLVRSGSLEWSGKMGSHFALEFSVGNYTYLHESKQADIAGSRPHWTPKGVVSGKWCFETDLPLVPTREQDEMQLWEASVKQLHQSPDFREQPVYLRVQGFWDVGARDGDSRSMRGGEWRVSSGAGFQVRVIHWHPDGDSSDNGGYAAEMSLSAGDDGLKLVTASRMPVESPYDVKRFHVQSLPTTSDRNSSLLLRVTRPNSETEDIPEMFLPVQVGASRARQVVSVVLLTGLLAAQQLVPVLLKQNWSPLVPLAVFALAFLTALVVVFGLKKPL